MLMCFPQVIAFEWAGKRHFTLGAAADRANIAMHRGAQALGAAFAANLA